MVQASEDPATAAVHHRCSAPLHCTTTASGAPYGHLPVTTRLERAVAFAFLFSGAHPWVIRPGFEAETPPQRAERVEAPLLDPTAGLLTVAEDATHIQSLLDVAKRSDAWGGGRSTGCVGWGAVDRLLIRWWLTRHRVGARTPRYKRSRSWAFA